MDQAYAVVNEVSPLNEEAFSAFLLLLRLKNCPNPILFPFTPAFLFLSEAVPFVRSFICSDEIQNFANL